MERNYLKADILVELDFITDRHLAFHSHENFEFLFVISGKLVITVEEDTYQLSPGDMLVVNINRKHSYNGSQDLVMARFLISYLKVRELLGQDQILFWCNSTVDHNEAYNEMRRLIVKILNQSMGNRERNRLYLRSMYYQLLHILTENFLLTEENLREETEKKKRMLGFRRFLPISGRITGRILCWRILQNTCIYRRFMYRNTLSSGAGLPLWNC